MIENTNVYKMYTADGTQRQWEFPYSYVEDDDMRVYQKHDTTLTRVSSSLYTFDPITKKVTYPKDQDLDPVPAGDIILIWRWTDVTQEEDSTVANFKSNDVERMTDKLTMICQELSDRLDRSITWDPTELDPDTDAVTLVESLEQYADDAVSAHNTSNAAHADIRSNISSLQSSKVNVSDVKSTFNPADLNPINGVGVQAAVSAEATLRENADDGLQSQITSLGNNKQDNLTTAQLAAVNSGIDSTKVAQIGTNTTNIGNEVLNRQAGDVALQGQIDALKAASDVADVVADYTELQAYDTSKLTDKALIKVLVDSTHSNAETYYRWSTSSSSFSYVGSAGASYTKAESDAKFLSQTDAAATYETQTAAASTYETQAAATAALALKASNADGSTITDNGSTISTVAVKEQNASAATKFWVGTKAQYDAITTKDNDTIYNVVDEPTIAAEGARCIGEVVPSILPLTEAGLHLLDGALISGSGVYSAFVTYIAGLISTYPSLFVTEAAWQTAVTTYGVCGKFVYDSENGTVRLPKITGIMEGTIDATALGDLVESGLPNITGTFTAGSNSIADPNTSGAISGSTSTGTGRAGGSSSSYMTIDSLDASRSSSVYGNSSTVQPQTIKGFYYIVIANSTKTDIQVDIDEIATDLNGKADVDLGNLSNAGKIVGSGLAMPSGTYDELTLGASGASYIAPADGYFCVRVPFTGNQACAFYNDTQLLGNQCAANGSWTSYTFCPAKKGDTVYLWYNCTPNLFRFVYAEGSKTEAN